MNRTHILKNLMETLGRKIGNRFIHPEMTSGISSITELDLNENNIFKENSTIFLGGTTKTELLRTKAIYHNRNLISSIVQHTCIIEVH